MTIRGMTGRASCKLSAATCQGLLKAHVPNLKEEAKYCSTDPEIVVKNYKDLLVSLAAITPRLNESVVKKAAMELYEEKPGIVTMFSDRLCQAFA